MEATLANPSQCTSLLPVKKQYSPNANHKKQLRFYTTKWKQEKSKSCTKPTFGEIKSTKDELSKTNIIVCAICFKKDDKCTDQYVEWIQCECCKIWMPTMYVW